jgi:glycosyltransferase involved in cell wall biosynthesis
MEAPKYDLLHLSDAVLVIIGYLVKKIYRKPVVVSLHGLDLTYNNPLYQIYLKLFGRSGDLYICNSRQTEKEAKKRGFKNLTMIPVGIDIDFGKQIKLSKPNLKKILERKLNLNLKEKEIISTIGRLVKRKGHYWFVQNVFPKLPKETLYLIAGEGPEKEKLNQLIKRAHLEKRVILLGKVSDETRLQLLKAADIFLMPNIKVKNDMEGFGLVALEAVVCGLPVIAAKLEGITEAIQDRKNGFLVDPHNVDGFIRLINFVNSNPQKINDFVNKAQKYTLARFSWNSIIKIYQTQFSQLIKNTKA